MPTHLDARSRERLRKLCKYGRLFEAQRFLDEKGSARLRKTRKWTPLFTAVDRGFHSLVEVLLRYEHAQWDLEKAYLGAVRRRRNDLAGLILRSPWWSEPIDPEDALATGDTELVCSLVASGTEFTREPVVALGALRNARGTIECLRAAKISLESVEAQLRAAMITHAERGNVKGVVHLLKAGINPHRPGDWFDEKDRPVDTFSAVHAAVYSRKPAMLRMLRPSPEMDDAEQLIGSATEMNDQRMLEVLLEAGFELNCQENGGSPALHDILKEAHIFRIRPGYSEIRSHDWGSFTAAIRWLLERGARWAGRNSEEYRHVRDSLIGMGTKGAGEVIEMLQEAGAIDGGHIKELFRTPRMKPLAKELPGAGAGLDR